MKDFQAKAAIFDLDGTLLDSAGVWAEVDRDFLARRGFDLPEDYAPAVSGMHLREAADYTVRRFSLRDEPADLIAEWMALAGDAYGTRVELKPGSREILRRLGERGMRLAVATSLARELATPALRRHGIWDRFETVVFASEVGEGKSSPAVFLEAARRLETDPSDCIVFEDSLAGVLSGKAAGMRVYALDDSSNRLYREEIAAAADGYFAGFSEWLSAFFGDR